MFIFIFPLGIVLFFFPHHPDTLQFASSAHLFGTPLPTVRFVIMVLTFKVVDWAERFLNQTSTLCVLGFISVKVGTAVTSPKIY